MLYLTLPTYLYMPFHALASFMPFYAFVCLCYVPKPRTLYILTNDFFLVQRIQSSSLEGGGLLMATTFAILSKVTTFGPLQPLREK